MAHPPLIYMNLIIISSIYCFMLVYVSYVVQITNVQNTFNKYFNDTLLKFLLYCYDFLFSQSLTIVVVVPFISMHYYDRDNVRDATYEY